MSSYYFLFQLILFISLRVQTAHSWICPNGYVYSTDGSCYKIIQANVLRNEAYMLCKRDGAHLPFIKSPITNSFIASKLTSLQNVWLGVTCIDPTNAYNCKYDDGNRLDYHSFPDDTIYINQSSNVFMEGSTWYVTNDTLMTASFVCQWIPNDFGCPANFKGFQDNCYLSVSGRFSAMEAAAYCQNQQAHLATIPSEADNNFITAYLKGSSTEYAYIGAQVLGNSSITWRDGSQTSYNNFAYINTDIGNCGIISTLSSTKNIIGQGMWMTSDCDNKYSVLCSISRSSEKLTSSPDVCLETYVITDRSGQISSPNYSQFSPPTECHYILISDIGNLIHLNVKEYIDNSLSSASSLIILNDFLQSSEAFRCSASSAQSEKFTSRRNSMHVIFKSQDLKQSKFLMEYQIGETNLGSQTFFNHFFIVIVLSYFYF